jgi:histidinol-phosphate/aromatic aminotransferase/cobyric acid decarboxylase-like protein
MSPHAPTGALLRHDEVEHFVTHVPAHVTVLLVDRPMLCTR